MAAVKSLPSSPHLRSTREGTQVPTSTSGKSRRLLSEGENLRYPCRATLENAWSTRAVGRDRCQSQSACYHAQQREDHWIEQYFFPDRDQWDCSDMRKRNQELHPRCAVHPSDEQGSDALQGLTAGAPTYIELGALDGRELSNSYHFDYMLGWKGLLIEALPNMCNKLAINRPDSVAACGAVCPAGKGKITFLQSDAVSGSVENGMSQAHVDAWSKGRRSFKETTVQCAPMSAIFEKIGMNYAHFFSLDVEEQEYQVLSTIDWAVFQFGVLLIELEDKARHVNQVRFNNDDKARALLDLKGYKFAGRLGMNEVWYNPNIAWAVEGARKFQMAHGHGN